MSIKAITHIRRLRGGSQAQLMVADDGREYVIKFQGQSTDDTGPGERISGWPLGPNDQVKRAGACHHPRRC